MKMQRFLQSRRWSVAAAVVAVGLAAPAHSLAQTREARSLRYSFGSVGVIPGQSLRVTIVNLTEPPEPDAPPDPEINPCWRVVLVNDEGRRIADSGDIELPPGRTR